MISNEKLKASIFISINTLERCLDKRDIVGAYDQLNYLKRAVPNLKIEKSVKEPRFKNLFKWL